MSTTRRTKTQKINFDQKYDAYLRSEGVEDDGNSNPHNLFDTLNIVDREWFKLAKDYIHQRSRGFMKDREEE